MSGDTTKRLRPKPATPLNVNCPPNAELRDYFAAHAPTEIASWFDPVVPEKPNRPTIPEHWPDDVQRCVGEVTC
jgi:hypothetical protein